LCEQLSERRRAGNAVLLTTHQMAFVDGLADRAVVLDEGAVADQGPWAEVRERAEARGWAVR
jgi:ABC-2 type transport system ATP-binding protein